MKRLMVVLMVLGFIGLSQAQGFNLGLNSITGHVGVALPDGDWDTGFVVGAEANIGEVYNGITLHPNVAYWSASYDWDSAGDSDTFTLSNIRIGADGHYAIEQVPGLYAGVGLALNFVSWEWSVIGYSEEYSETELGFDAVAGYEFMLGNFGAVAAGRYSTSTYDTIELTLGIKFDMAK